MDILGSPVLDVGKILNYENTQSKGPVGLFRKWDCRTKMGIGTYNYQEMEETDGTKTDMRERLIWLLFGKSRCLPTGMLRS